MEALYQTPRVCFGRTDLYEDKLTRADLTPSRRCLISRMENEIDAWGGYPPGSFGIYRHLIKIPSEEWYEPLEALVRGEIDKGMNEQETLRRVLGFIHHQRAYMKREMLLLYIPIHLHGSMNIILNDLQILVDRSHRLLKLALLAGTDALLMSPHPTAQ